MVFFLFYSLKAQLSDKKSLQTELKAAKEKLNELERKIYKLEMTIDAEKNEKMDLLNEKEKFEKANQEKLASLNLKNESLQTEVNELQKKIVSTTDIGSYHIFHFQKCIVQGNFKLVSDDFLRTFFLETILIIIFIHTPTRRTKLIMLCYWTYVF